jgi:hypothetical protein
MNLAQHSTPGDEVGAVECGGIVIAAQPVRAKLNGHVAFSLVRSRAAGGNPPSAPEYTMAGPALRDWMPALRGHDYSI